MCFQGSNHKIHRSPLVFRTVTVAKEEGALNSDLELLLFPEAEKIIESNQNKLASHNLSFRLTVIQDRWMMLLDVFHGLLSGVAQLEIFTQGMRLLTGHMISLKLQRDE